MIASDLIAKAGNGNTELGGLVATMMGIRSPASGRRADAKYGLDHSTTHGSRSTGSRRASDQDLQAQRIFFARWTGGGDGQPALAEATIPTAMRTKSRRPRLPSTTFVYRAVSPRGAEGPRYGRHSKSRAASSASSTDKPKKKEIAQGVEEREVAQGAGDRARAYSGERRAEEIEALMAPPHPEAHLEELQPEW